jgi:hypothetical protein
MILPDSPDPIGLAMEVIAMPYHGLVNSREYLKNSFSWIEQDSPEKKPG